MSPASPHRARAEVLKLSRALGCEPGRLEALEAADPAELRVLREQVSDALFAVHRDGFARIAAMSEKLPASVAATMAQKVLGAPLSARAAALLAPEKAVELAGRVSPEFLTEVAVSVDVRHVGHLVAQIPPPTVAETTGELARRQEWVVLGAMLTHLAPEGLVAAVEVLDPGALLHTGFVAEDPARLDEVVALLSDERLEAVVQEAERSDLQEELAQVVGHLTGEQRARAERLLAG